MDGFIEKYRKETLKSSRDEALKNRTPMERLANAVDFTWDLERIPHDIRVFHRDLIENKFEGVEGRPQNAMHVLEYWMEVIDQYILKKTEEETLPKEGIFIDQYKDQCEADFEENEWKNPFYWEGVSSYKSKVEGISDLYETMVVQSVVFEKGDLLAFKGKSVNKQILVASDSENKEDFEEKKDILQDSDLSLEKISKICCYSNLYYRHSCR